MKNKNNRNEKIAWFDVLIESLNFIVIQYILGCTIYSLQKNPLFIIFFACDFFVISKFLSYLAGTISQKVLRYIVFSFCIVILLTLYFFVGLLSVSTTFTKGGLAL